MKPYAGTETYMIIESIYYITNLSLKISNNLSDGFFEKINPAVFHVKSLYKTFF